MIPATVLEGIFEQQFGKPPADFWPLLVHCLIGIALIEELCKMAAGLYPVWNDPEFNEENDGIVYVTAASLGFAGLENIMYVAQDGLGVGIMRAILALPMHMCCGVIIGY